MRTRLRRVRCFVPDGLKLLGSLDDKRLLPTTEIEQEIGASGRLGILLCNIHDGPVQVPCGIEKNGFAETQVPGCAFRTLCRWPRQRSMVPPRALRSTAAHVKATRETAVEGAAERDGFKGQPPSKRGAFKAWGQRHDAGAIKAGLLCSLRRQVGDFQDLPSGLPGGEWANVSSAFKLEWNVGSEV